MSRVGLARVVLAAAFGLHAAPAFAWGLSAALLPPAAVSWTSQYYGSLAAITPLGAFNRSNDRDVLAPEVPAHRTVVSRPTRPGIRHVLADPRTQVIRADPMPWGGPRHAGDTLAPFVIDWTPGVAGIPGVAGSRFGVPGHDEEFGQTSSYRGIGEGPCPVISIPVIGLSDPFGPAGFGLGIAADPPTRAGPGVLVEALMRARAGVPVADTREDPIESPDTLESMPLGSSGTLRGACRRPQQVEIRDRSSAGATAAVKSGAGSGFPSTPGL